MYSSSLRFSEPETAPLPGARLSVPGSASLDSGIVDANPDSEYTQCSGNVGPSAGPTAPLASSSTPADGFGADDTNDTNDANDGSSVAFGDGSKKNWTLDQDYLLVNEIVLLLQSGKKKSIKDLWSCISPKVGRSSGSCYQRWYRIKHDIVAHVARTTKMSQEELEIFKSQTVQATVFLATEAMRLINVQRVKHNRHSQEWQRRHIPPGNSQEMIESFKDTVRKLQLTYDGGANCLIRGPGASDDVGDDVNPELNYNGAVVFSGSDRLPPNAGGGTQYVNIEDFKSGLSGSLGRPTSVGVAEGYSVHPHVHSVASSHLGTPSSTCTTQCSDSSTNATIGLVPQRGYPESMLPSFLESTDSSNTPPSPYPSRKRELSVGPEDSFVIRSGLKRVHLVQSSTVVHDAAGVNHSPLFFQARSVSDSRSAFKQILPGTFSRSRDRSHTLFPPSSTSAFVMPPLDPLFSAAAMLCRNSGLLRPVAIRPPPPMRAFTSVVNGPSSLHPFSTPVVREPSIQDLPLMGSFSSTSCPPSSIRAVPTPSAPPSVTPSAPSANPSHQSPFYVPYRMPFYSAVPTFASYPSIAPSGPVQAPFGSPPNVFLPQSQCQPSISGVPPSSQSQFWTSHAPTIPSASVHSYQYPQGSGLVPFFRP